MNLRLFISELENQLETGHDSVELLVDGVKLDIGRIYEEDYSNGRVKVVVVAKEKL